MFLFQHARKNAPKCILGCWIIIANPATEARVNVYAKYMPKTPTRARVWLLGYEIKN